MREVVLLQKIYGVVSLEEFEELLKGLFKGLRVGLIGLSIMENEWVKIMFSGEDENVAVRFLANELGLAPITIRNVERFSVLHGRVVFSGRTRVGVFVDVGVLSPEPVYAIVPLERLQGQLVDSEKFALERIVELFGFVDGFPLEVRVFWTGESEFKVELTEKQLKLFSSWIDSRVDRLVVLGALSGRLKEVVERVRLDRDVLGVESLGVLEHVVVCKLGTDAVGLASMLGKWLPGVEFACFSPRRVLELVGGRW